MAEVKSPIIIGGRYQLVGYTELSPTPISDPASCHRVPIAEGIQRQGVIFKDLKEQIKEIFENEKIIDVNKGFSIGSRFDRYLQDVCYVDVIDLKTGQQIQLRDYGRDGLDVVIRGSETITSKSDVGFNEYLPLYRDVQRLMRVRIPTYFGSFNDLVYSRRMERGEIAVGIIPCEAGNGSSRLTIDIDCTTPEGKRHKFGFKKFGDEPSITDENSVFSLVDPDTGLSIFISGYEGQGPLMEGAFAYLDPLTRVASLSGGEVHSRFSGRWLPYLQSDEFDALDGEVNCDGNPDELDFQMAAVAHQAASEGLREDDHRFGDGIDILRRYRGERDIEKFAEFVRGEKSAVLNINGKLKKVLGGTDQAEDWEEGRKSLHISGRLKFESADRSNWDPYCGNYFIYALDLVVQRRSGGRYSLREKSLSYIDRCITVDGDRLIFMDKGQNADDPVEIPITDVLMIVDGRFSFRKPGINIDGYYLYDENEDGIIDAEHDLVQKKDSFGTERRMLVPVDFDEMLEDLKSRYPPPFDTKRFSNGGVPLEELRGWADTINSSLVIEQDVSDNPMEDGRYRAMIFRANNGEVSGFMRFLLSVFAYINDIDDLYIVPQGWGMEIALNEIAGRGLPIDYLYIGTHSDNELTTGDILLDYDRRLIFAENGMVTVTGCYMDKGVALALGSQIFRHSSGRMLWANGFNIPSPFLGIWTSEGDSYSTEFENGHEVETRRDNILDSLGVDPIPSNLF